MVDQAQELPHGWRNRSGKTGPAALGGLSVGSLATIVIVSLIASNQAPKQPPPPSAPTGLEVTVPTSWGRRLELRWTANAEKDIDHYSVYRRTDDASTYDGPFRVKTSSFSDTNLENGRTYSYVVTAVNAIGAVSTDSREISGVPANTLLPILVKILGIVVILSGAVGGISWFVVSAAAKERIEQAQSKAIREKKQKAEQERREAPEKRRALHKKLTDFYIAHVPHIGEQYKWDEFSAELHGAINSDVTVAVARRRAKRLKKKIHKLVVEDRIRRAQLEVRERYGKLSAVIGGKVPHKIIEDYIQRFMGFDRALNEVLTTRDDLFATLNRHYEHLEPGMAARLQEEEDNRRARDARERDRLRREQVERQVRAEATRYSDVTEDDIQRETVQRINRSAF